MPLRILPTASLAAIALAVSPLSAQTYEQVASLPQILGEAPGTRRIGGVGTLGGTLFPFIAQNVSNNGVIRRGEGGPPFSTLTTNSQIVFGGGDAGGFEAQFVGTVGTDLRFVSTLANPGAFSVSTASGAVTQLVSQSQVRTFTGATNNQTGAQTVTPAGDLVWYDSSARWLLRNNGNVGNLSALGTREQIGGKLGSDNFTVNGLAAVGDTLFFGWTGDNSVFSLDLAAADPVDSITRVLGIGQIGAITGAAGANFGSMIAGGDGRVYFYDSNPNARSVLSFDPADPAGSLGLVIDSAALNAGPSSDRISQLFWFDDDLHWTYTIDNANLGTVAGIYVIPEPGTLALLGVGGLALLRRRRA